VGASQAEAAKDKPKQKMVTLEDQIVCFFIEEKIIII